VPGIDERADLNPAKPACGERVDQRDLVSRRDRTRLDLKAFAGPSSLMTTLSGRSTPRSSALSLLVVTQLAAPIDI
jgi:hypothetical protein